MGGKRTGMKGSVRFLKRPLGTDGSGYCCYTYNSSKGEGKHPFSPTI